MNEVNSVPPPSDMHTDSVVQVGRSIVGTIALFLVVLMASPVYDIYSLHQQKHRSADNLMSQERRSVICSSAS